MGGFHRHTSRDGSWPSAASTLMCPWLQNPAFGDPTAPQAKSLNLLFSQQGSNSTFNPLLFPSVHSLGSYCSQAGELEPQLLFFSLRAVLPLFHPQTHKLEPANLPLIFSGQPSTEGLSSGSISFA